MGSRSLRAFEHAGRNRSFVVPIGEAHRMVLSRILVAFLILSVPLCGGCGGAKVVPVDGQVKLDGKPLAECAVMFTPVAHGPMANGTTDAEGRFQLATTNRSGVAVGDYNVTIIKQRVMEVVDKATGNRRLNTQWLTPEKYSRPETSGLRKTVSDQEHEFSFELLSK
jgi:hypothetical protein